MYQQGTRKTAKPAIWLPVLSVITILSIIIYVIAGLDSFGPVELLALILGEISGSGSAHDELVPLVMQIRVPRALLAVFAGGALALAGVVFQNLLRNVLADPYILGIASGAAVGAYMVMLTGAFTIAYFVLPVGAFIGSAIVAGLVYLLSRSKFTRDHNSLLLGGVMIGTFLSSFLLLILSVERSNYQTALKWLLGSLSNATLESLYYIVPVVLIAGVFVILKSPSMNILSLGKETATSLGVSPGRLSGQLYVAGSLLTAIIVCFTGSIGFVGLVIPHICRLVFGPDHRSLAPLSFVLGALFMLLADFIAKTIVYPIELPVGAITAMIGAPVFILLLRKS